jgi:hypothetical protein
MFAKQDHIASARLGSGTTRKARRQCVPRVAPLEDRNLLSTASVHLAPAAVSPHSLVLNHTAQVANVDAAGTIKAESFRTIQFPGGWVAFNRRTAHVSFPGGSVNSSRFGGTHVFFPGGSVNANRFGFARVFFPGGSVIARRGHVFVSWPGGSFSF